MKKTKNYDLDGKTRLNKLWIKERSDVTRFLLILCLGFIGFSCSEEKQRAEPPNILWLYVEDISPNLGCYGDKNVNTPNIDRLANNGLRFANAIMPAPVCSPLRSAIITGTMPTTFGLHNHHSSRTEASAIRLPEGVKTLPELFKREGYFTFNQGKDDYNFQYTRDSLYTGKYRDNGLYGLVGEEVDWSQKGGNQPYFGQIQFSGNKYIYHADFQEKLVRQIRSDKLKLPPYYPQTSYMREEWASYLESIELTDKAVGETLADLKEKGLLKNTYVFFFSDHGMRLWRHKQFLYEGGIKVPLILSYFDKNGNLENFKGRNDGLSDELINGLDIGATSIGLAKITPPEYIQGKDFLADDYIPRDHVISVRDRCDFTIDRIRSVRTKDFKYIRNFMTDRPYMQPNYRDDWEITKTIRKAYEEGQLNEIQARFWKPERPQEELYDLKNDPHELINLASDPTYVDALQLHRDLLENWIFKTDDKGQYREGTEGLKVMYGIWGDRCVNPEYDPLKEEDPEFSGMLKNLKS